MTNQAATLVAGIGSFAGDDQAGWLAVSLLRERARVFTTLWSARNPLDLLGKLEGICQLHVIDAAVGTGAAGTIRRWVWPELPAINGPVTGTHGIGLPALLRLAEQLEILPSQTIVWTIERGSDTPADELSAEVVAAVGRVVALLESELSSSSVNRGKI